MNNRCNMEVALDEIDWQWDCLCIRRCVKFRLTSLKQMDGQFLAERSTSRKIHFFRREKCNVFETKRIY